MFSGIIADLGQVSSNDGVKLTVKSQHFIKHQPRLGASIAVDGVCLTVMEKKHDQISFELGQETCKLTYLAKLKQGCLVNLEPALKLGDEIDGHMVQGHVDGQAYLTKREQSQGNLILHFRFPKKLDGFLVKKGSVALNGVSLTINSIEKDVLTVCLVPYTIKATNLQQLEINDPAHIEVDILGRYIAKAMAKFKD